VLGAGAFAKGFLKVWSFRTFPKKDSGYRIAKGGRLSRRK